MIHWRKQSTASCLNIKHWWFFARTFHSIGFAFSYIWEEYNYLHPVVNSNTFVNTHCSF
jgi:hypothetical protein